MNSEVMQHSEKIWNYLASFSSEGQSDAIVVCCSYDLRVCDHACNLFKQGVADKIVLSGNISHWTSMLWDIPEADVFKKRAIENGIDPKNIIIEDKATNTGENIKFSNLLLGNTDKVTYVSKPNMTLRIKLTVPKHASHSTFYVSSPKQRFPDDISNIIGVFGIIHEMVGDIDRIIKYPALDFQENFNLPEEIVSSWEFLKTKGFTLNIQ